MQETLRKKIEHSDILDFINSKISKKSGSNEGLSKTISTTKQLAEVIKKTLDISIPEQAICPGHSSPFQFVDDNFFDRQTNSLVIGPRNGGKTMNFAILEFMESSQKPGCESAHLGSIMAQAKRAYKYIFKWAYQHKRELHIPKITREETIFGNGASVEIIPGTMNGVNSPHPQKVTIDEFELLSWDIFEEAQSMAKSTPKIPLSQRLGTTRKFPNGNAQKMINEAPKKGYKVYKYCIFEVMTGCDCTGSKCDNKYDKYISYDREGKGHTWSSVCNGKARRAKGYYNFTDVLKKFIDLTWEMFSTQWLCNRPETSDNTFGEFHYEMHVIDSYTFNNDLESLRGWDFGLDDPNVCLFGQLLPSGDLVIFDEMVASGELIEFFGIKVNKVTYKFITSKEYTGTDEELIDWTEENTGNFEDWGDPSGKAKTGVTGASYISQLSDINIYINYIYKFIDEGILAIKKRLLKSSHTGKPRLYILKSCVKLINALELAQWDRQKGEIKKSREKYKHDEHSHPLDALRYLITGIDDTNSEVDY